MKFVASEISVSFNLTKYNFADTFFTVIRIGVTKGSN